MASELVQWRKQRTQQLTLQYHTQPCWNDAWHGTFAIRKDSAGICSPHLSLLLMLQHGACLRREWLGVHSYAWWRRVGKHVHAVA